jgi:hypothetical protein
MALPPKPFKPVTLAHVAQSFDRGFRTIDVFSVWAGKQPYFSNEIGH